VLAAAALDQEATMADKSCMLQPTGRQAIAMAMDGFYRYWYSFSIYYVLVGGTNFL